MTASRDDLELAWAQLDPPSVTALASFDLGACADGRPFRAALDRQGRRHLLVPVEDGFRTPTDRLPLLGLTTGKFMFDGHTEDYLDIECRDPLYEEQFARFAVDVVASAAPVRRPGGAALAVVGKWRRLFGSGQVGSLDARRRVALAAELTFLQSLIEAGAPADAEAWRGPLREVHDFVVGADAFEVKAVGDESDHVTIHGLDQLAPPPSGRVTLCVALVVEDPHGRSLHEMAGDVRALLDETAGFDDRLARAGLTPAEPATTYEVRAWWIVPEGAGLPRLVPSSLVEGRAPEGVSRVQYDIDAHAVRRCADGRTVGDVTRGVMA